MIEVICTRVGNTQNTCQILKFQFQQQATLFFLVHAQQSPCAAHERSRDGQMGSQMLGPVEWPFHGKQCVNVILL